MAGTRKGWDSADGQPGRPLTCLSVSLEDPPSTQHWDARRAPGEAGARVQVCVGQGGGAPGGQEGCKGHCFLSVLAAPRSSRLQLKERHAGGGCAGLLNESGACGSSWKPGRPAGTARGSAPMGLVLKRSCRSWSCALRRRGSVCAVHCCGAGSCGPDWGMAPSSGHCACCRYHRRKAEGPHGRAVHGSLFYIQTRLCTLQLNSIERASHVLSRHLRVRARALDPVWAL